MANLAATIPSSIEVSHMGEWLAWGVMIVFAFALCIASLKIVFWLLTRNRDTDATGSDYWRRHGGA
jgi:hypothetical protein